MRATAAFALTLLLTGAPAFAWDWTSGTVLKGSGRIIRSDRQLSAFKGLTLEVPASVEVIQGDSEGVTVEVDDNLVTMLETVVENDELKIRPARRLTGLRDANIKITVRARAIERLAISGSGAIRAEKIRSEALATRITGSGDIVIASLDVGALSVSISGNGDFSAGGRADSVKASISGSGNIKTARLAAKDVKLSIAGSGNVQVWAAQTLDVDIAGSGNVDYYGDATLSRSVAGSGSIRRLGNAPGKEI